MAKLCLVYQLAKNRTAPPTEDWKVCVACYGRLFQEKNMTFGTNK